MIHEPFVFCRSATTSRAAWDCLHRRRWVGCSLVWVKRWVAGNLMRCTSREMGGLACLRSRARRASRRPPEVDVMPCVSRQRAHSNMDKGLSYAQSAVQARLCIAGPSQATTKSVDSRSCEWGATVCCAGMRTAVPTGRAWCCCLGRPGHTGPGRRHDELRGVRRGERAKAGIESPWERERDKVSGSADHANGPATVVRSEASRRARGNLWVIGQARARKRP